MRCIFVCRKNEKYISGTGGTIRCSRCKEYVATSSKYKERVMLLKSMYKAIKVDLLYDVHIQVNKHIIRGVVEVERI